MDPKFWHDKWKASDIGFNRQAPHGALVKHFPAAAQGAVMVPLCGKSIDMVWLRSQGLEVVGVELSPIACEAFFAENGVPLTKRVAGDFQVFEGGGYTLWCGDFFTVPDEAWARCTHLYDRAALVALPADLRRRYAASIAARFKGKSMLLITMSYPGPETLGPPFSVTDEEVQRLYGAAFKAEMLETGLDSAVRRADKFNGIEITESTYLIRR